MLPSQRIVCPKCSHENEYAERLCSNCHSELPNPYKLPYALNPRILAGTWLGDKLHRKTVIALATILVLVIGYLIFRGHGLVETLIVDLKDSIPEKRVRAARTLGEINDPRALQPLISALQDENSNVRQNAAWALGKIGDPAAMPALGAILQSEKTTPGTRRTVSAAIAKIKAMITTLVGVHREIKGMISHCVEDETTGKRVLLAGEKMSPIPDGKRIRVTGVMRKKRFKKPDQPLSKQQFEYPQEVECFEVSTVEILK